MTWRKNDVVVFNQKYTHKNTQPNTLAVILSYEERPENESLVEVFEVLRGIEYRCYEYRVTKIGELQDA